MFRDLLARRRMLIVLDNAQNTDQLKDLLPGSPGSMVLITSRHQLHALVAAYQALPLTLLPLTHADARGFLDRRLGTTRTQAEPEAVDRIIRFAGRLPRTLAHFAARAAYRPQTSLTTLADEYAPTEPEPAALFRALRAWPETVFATTAITNTATKPTPWHRQTLPQPTHTHHTAHAIPDRRN